MVMQLPSIPQKVRRHASAFTIVELLVVIAVIGVLATLTLIGFTRFQADSRDAQRSAKATVIVEALEKYYDENGEYPGCSAITQNATTVRNNVLNGIDTTSLKTPLASAGETNSIKCQSLSSISGDFFEYDGDGSTTCESTSGTSCLEFTLRYREDASGQIKSITSRRIANISTSNSLNLAGTPSFTQIALSWNGVDNATGYTLQRDTYADFRNGSSNQTPYGPTATSATITGLAANTTYYFRIMPNAQSTQGSWSTFSTTTLSLSAPANLQLSTSGTTLIATWNASTNATRYDVQCSTDGSTWPLPASGCAASVNHPTLTTSFTGRTAGQIYHVRVRATNVPASYSSNWSTPESITMVPPAPTGTSCSQVSGNSGALNVNWSAAAGATSYRVQLSTNSAFSSIASETTAPTGTSHQFTGLNGGTTYHCRVMARVGSVESGPSNVGSATTWIGGGITYFAGGSPAGVRHTSAGWWVGYDGGDCWNYFTSGCGNYYHEYVTINGSCPAGTTFRYTIHAYYRNSSGSWTGDHRYASGAGNATWYYVNAYSPYYSAFDASAYCDGPNADSPTYYTGTVMY